MFRTAYVIALLASAPALAGEWSSPDGNVVIMYGGEHPIGPPVCSPPPPGISQDHCAELVVAGSAFNVLTVGPGGRICGPATVRAFKEGDPALELGPGVCIPAESK